MRKEIMKNITDEDFKDIVLKSKNYAQICKRIGLRLQGSNYNTIKKRIKRQNISIDHFVRFSPFSVKEKSLEEVFVKNSSFNNNVSLKNKILKNNLLEYKCQKCYNLGEWEQDVLVLQMDHINGDRKDNRLENLRFLCPNCHSQTLTHSGRRFKKPQPKCPKCGKNFKGKGKNCLKCLGYKARKIKRRPHKDQLKKMIEETSYCAVARKYGVSDNAIRKWLK